MIPWEKDIYVSLLQQHIEEENLKAQQIKKMDKSPAYENFMNKI